MANSDYPVVILPVGEEDGGGYMAYAPDLPGCMGDGDTVEAAARDLSSAIGEWLDEAWRLNREAPEPCSFLNAAKADRDRIEDLLGAQDKLIKQQDAVIRQQDEGLRNAKADLERVKASACDALTHSGEDHRRLVSLYAIVGSRVIDADVVERLPTTKGRKQDQYAH